MLIVGIHDLAFAKKIAKKNRAKYTTLDITYFPDREMLVKFKKMDKKVVIVQTMHPEPNQRMLEAIWACYTARQLGAKRVELIAPYLCYMRQDKRFKPGESQSNIIMSNLFSCFDKVTTVDPHLHRIRSLSEIFKIRTKRITANPVIAAYIKKKFSRPIVIGPDWESFQWAKVIGKQVGCKSTVLRKERFSSRKVRVYLTEDVVTAKKDVIIVDDIISSGRTIIEAAKKLRDARSITAICVHGLFMEGAIDKMKKAGIKHIITTNTIISKHSKIDVSGLIVD